MQSLQITFLGTGTSQGVPVIGCDCEVCKSTDLKDKRLRTSILIESETTTIVIDAGPDFRQQMLREKVQKIDAVVFTHEHKDHIAGLDDIRAFNFKLKKDIPIYASNRVANRLKIEYDYAFSEYKYPGVPEMVIEEIRENENFTIGDLAFTPISVLHYKMPVFGFRVRNFTYITDANFISDEEKNKIKGSDVFVLNALRYEEHISHYNVAQATELMNELKPTHGYFIHMSHNLGLHEIEEKKLPHFIQYSYDGLKLSV